MQKTASLTTQIVASLAFFSIHTFFYAADNNINVLHAERNRELKTGLLQTQESSLQRLYEWTGNKSLLLVMPKEQLDTIQNPESELKQVFEDNIVTGTCFVSDRAPSTPWTSKEWDKALDILKWRSQEHTEEEIIEREDFLFELGHEKILYKDVPTILHDAKTILKALLPKQPLHRENYFEKSVKRLNRTFTYVMLSKVIEEERLTHIHLPYKALIIKDKITDTPLSYHDASVALDKAVHVYVNFYSHVDLSLDYYSDQYKIIIWAEKIKKHNLPFNTATSKELVQLIKKAPFDVGGNNIFADAHGDAIIIDTEFKGEPADSSIAKVGRYDITIEEEQTV